MSDQLVDIFFDAGGKHESALGVPASEIMTKHFGGILFWQLPDIEVMDRSQREYYRLINPASILWMRWYT